MSSDTDEIQSLLEQHVAAANKGDLQGYGRTLAVDVVYMPPDSPAIIGRDQVLVWMGESFFGSFVPPFQTRFDEVRSLGTSAFARGSFIFELATESGSERIMATGKFMNAFRKEEDGSWKYTHSIWNLDRSLG